MGVLRSLVDWAGENHAAFVGLNPLHALNNRGADISPYSPLSRLYRNVIYIDIEQVPELADCAEARSLIASSDFQRQLTGLRERRHVAYESVMALKSSVLRLLHRAFVDRHRDRNTERGQAYADFVERRGESLTGFATFVVLADHLNSAHGPDWRLWPAPYRSPHTAEVETFRQSHSDQIDMQRYLQFELDRQIASVGSAGGLPIGLYGDLAIGTADSYGYFISPSHHHALNYRLPPHTKASVLSSRHRLIRERMALIRTFSPKYHFKPPKELMLRIRCNDRFNRNGRQRPWIPMPIK